MEQASIYIELDALLDTRLATLFQMDPVQTQRVIQTGYFSRLYDEFEGFDGDAFKQAYGQRNLSTLKDAVATQAIDFINFFSAQTLKALVTSPFRRQPRAVINVYPYPLDDTVIPVLIQGVRAATKRMIDIEVVYLPLEEVTPHLLKSHYVVAVMYAYWEWLEAHALNRNLEKVQCPEITLIGPALLKSKDAAHQLKEIDPFKVVERYTEPYIKLRLYPAEKFSYDFRRHKQPPGAAPSP
jgi:hypothetical protein